MYRYYLALCLLIVALISVSPIYAAMEVVNVPSTIGSSQESQVTVNLSGLGKNTIYYLKAAFYKTTANYFGLTWNGSQWVENSASYTNQFVVITDSDGSVSTNLKFKADEVDSGYTGPGDYSFKVARYTPSGSLSWSSAFPISITQDDPPPPDPSPNPTPPPSGTGSVSLSEFLPNPNIGGNEWVEVYNPSSNAVDLANWQFKDSVNHAKNLSGNIGAHSYKVFEYSSGWLNNGGDILNLIDPSGKTVEKYQYGETTKEYSFAKNSSGRWSETSTPTPGKVNKITQPYSGSESSYNSNSTNPPSETLGSKDYNQDMTYATASANFIDDKNPNSISTENNSDTKPNNVLPILMFCSGIAFIGTGIGWPLIKTFKPL